MTERKVRGWDAAAGWRETAEGTVVFTNGVFDLLHPGHVWLLEEARRLGEALVVGINDDASGQRLGKGRGRPVVDADSRARVVAALAAVDCVVLFAEDTPEKLIRHLRPDILVKGEDYEMESIPGRDVVEAQGGRVIRVALREGHSSTAIVDRIRGAG